MTNGTRRGRGVCVTPRPLLTPGKDLVPFVQEAVWAPVPVWTGAENLAQPGFDPRTVQPVASRYTDYATRIRIRDESIKLCASLPDESCYVCRVLHQDRLSSMNKQNHLFEIAGNWQEVSECLV
jgi:hypothetical protein